LREEGTIRRRMDDHVGAGYGVTVLRITVIVMVDKI
jgi:hypothetical protein